MNRIDRRVREVGAAAVLAVGLLATGRADAQASGANAGATAQPTTNGPRANRNTQRTGTAQGQTGPAATTTTSTASPAPATSAAGSSAPPSSGSPIVQTPITGAGSSAPPGTPPASSGTLLPNSTASDQGPHFTLPEAIVAMGRAHPLLAAARANITSAEFAIRAAALWLNPTLNILYDRSVTPWTAYDSRLGYLSLTVSQQIEVTRLPTARRDVAEYERRATVADSTGVYRGLVFDVYTAFMALVEATNRIAILQETAAELAEAQRVVNARVTAGASPPYDFSRMSLALADARAAVGDAEADVMNARGNLDVAVGPGAASLNGVPQFDLVASPPLPTLNELLDAIVNTRSDIVAAQHRAQESAAQVLVARRSVFEGFTLYGALGVGGGPGQSLGQTTDPNNNGITSSGGQPQYDVMFGVSFPMPFVDHGQGTIPYSQARATAMFETVRALRLAAGQRVTWAYNEVMRRREALQAYIDTGAAESAAMRRQAQAAYREGRIQVLDLVDAYTAVRDAQLRLLSLALDARNAEINLWRAAGNVH